MKFFRIIAVVFAWLLIVWGALGLAANGADLYTTDSSNKADIFTVIAFHVMLIATGLLIRKKTSHPKSKKTP